MPKVTAHRAVAEQPFATLASDPADLITEPCTVVIDGQPCRQDSYPGTPFPLCIDHLTAAYRHVETVIHTTAVDAVARSMMGVTSRPARCGKKPRMRPRDQAMKGWPSVVYYMLVGDHVKIGYSEGIQHRVRDYPPCAKLLALEPGDRSIEKYRHRQFGHLLAARHEWFELGEDLMAHIQQLARAGLPHAPQAVQ